MHSAVRPNWTRSLCTYGWWKSPRCPVLVQCLIFGKLYVRCIPREGSRRLSVVTGEAQGNWRSMGANVSLLLSTTARRRQWRPYSVHSFPWVREVEVRDLSLLGSTVDIPVSPGTVHEKSVALEKNDVSIWRCWTQVREVEARDLSLLESTVDIPVSPGTVHEKSVAFEKMTFEVGGAEPTSSKYLLCLPL